VNSVLFTIRVITGEGFTDFLKRVSDNAAQCFAHQNYPLEIVCQEMKKRYPDIPVAFNMANLPGERETRCLDSYEPGHGSKSQDVKFDLETYVFEYRNGIDTMWAYKKSMFSALMIEYFVRDYVKLLEFFTEYPHKNYMDFKTVCQKKKITLTKK
jgi:non-ribosomal peptide synthetase component F